MATPSDVRQCPRARSKSIHKRQIPAYQPLPPFGFTVRRNCYIRPRVPDCGPAREAGPPLKVASKRTHVQTNSDRKSRRDRLPGHQDGPPHGNRNRGRLFRGRPGRAPCRDGGRRRFDRTAGRRRKLSPDGEDRRGLPQDRRASRASRLRIPVGARSLSARAGGCRHRLHRAQSRRHRRHGRQDRVRRRLPRRPTSRPCRASLASSPTKDMR